MLTIITTGRDDDYGIGFVSRLAKSITENTKTLDELDVKYEYIISEWNPLKDILLNNPLFEDISNNPNVREVVVTKSVVDSENLDNNAFYEYFAKNAAVRNSRYENLLIINGDIILPKETILQIKSIIDDGFDENSYYRLRYRVDINSSFEESSIIDIGNNSGFDDSHLYAFFSGDFLLIKKSTFIEKGNGYDETNEMHRSNAKQSSMDGEILWNLFNNGVKPILLNSKYYHIFHSTSGRILDNVYNKAGYSNKKNWGFIDYEHIIGNKLTFIK